jgi:hypothetical protein
MVASMSRMKAILLWLGSSVLAQNIDPTYGNNYTPVSKDDDAITRNFPDIDIGLLSPAFLNPETVPEGFANGTAGPTPDFVMSMSVESYLKGHANTQQTTSSRRSHLAMIGTTTTSQISRQSKAALFHMYTSRNRPKVRTETPQRSPSFGCTPRARSMEMNLLATKVLWHC